RSLLEAVPAGSRYASRARHMLGLAALEHGRVEEGQSILRELIARDSTYAARREGAPALAAGALDSSPWLEATRAYDGLDRDWTAQRDSLKALLARGDFGPLWAAWPSDPARSDAFALDGDLLARLADSLATASLSVAVRPGGEVPSLATLASAPRSAALAPPP